MSYKEKKILYEDNHLLLINKPAGALTQGDQTGDDTILDHYKGYIKKKYQKPGNVFLAAAHRLDRPVSGCLILGRTSKGLSRITQAFKNQEVTKRYLAVVDQRPPLDNGRLTDHLLKDGKRNVTKVVSGSHPQSKKAVLDYELIGEHKGRYLLSIEPKTGRSHQIRVQLSHMGCPIHADLRYGGTGTTEDRSIALHCFSMTFDHPTLRESMTVRCMPPKIKVWEPFCAVLKNLLTT